MDLSTTPGMAPPDGQTSDFDAPYNSLQWGTVIAFTISYFFATVLVGLRAFQAIKLVKKIEVDLIFILLSYGVSLVYFVTMHHLMDYGWGKHLWDVSIAQLVEFDKGLLPNTLAYLICPSITKMAALSMLYKINPSAIYRGIVVFVITAIFVYTLVLCIITGGPCNPLKSGTTKCLENVALAQASLNIISDFAVIAIPIQTIHNLHLPTKQKISLGCLLAAGSGVVVCSIARLPYVVKLGYTEDVTYTEAILGVWTIVELNLGIFCACAMRIKPLVVQYLPQLDIFSSRTDKKASGSRWGTNKLNLKGASNSYQLHSYQKGSADPVLEDGKIHVQRSYDVDVGDDGRS